MANNISALAFFRGTPIPDDAVQAAAAAVEKKAYTVARVEARTTTGVRCGRRRHGGGCVVQVSATQVLISHDFDHRP